MAVAAAGLDYGFLPPEINSGRMWAGPGSGALAASGAAWQALAADLGSAGAAMQAVVEALTGTSWLGPSSMTMAAAAAPYVVWMLATAAQCEQAAMAAAQAAMAFEAARAGVVPPAEIEENRERLRVLIATNWPFNQNAAAIAATEADYDRMWSQDATVLYGYAADAAGVTGSLVPFVPPAPSANPAGFATQAAAVADAGGTAAGNSAQKASAAGMQAAALPGGVDAQTMLSMGPQLMGTIPQVLQGLAQPAMQGLSAPTQGLGQFQSLLSPFMGMMSNPGLMGGLAADAVPAAAASAAPGLAGPMAAPPGRPVSRRGWVTRRVSAGCRFRRRGRPARRAAPSRRPRCRCRAPRVRRPLRRARAPTGTGGAPVAAMAPRDSDPGSGAPRYGTPVRVLPGPR